MMSGEGKAETPILSEANLATITPSSTNPDITDPTMAAQYKPKGKAIYFRTVTTDAFQGPNMANWMQDKLKIKSVYVLDDSGAYGVGTYDGMMVIADAIKRVAESGKEVNRDNVRHAMQTAKVKTLQGEVSFDANGDMITKVVSVFRYHENKDKPIDDFNAQNPYIGVAPETPQS